MVAPVVLAVGGCWAIVLLAGRRGTFTFAPSILTGPWPQCWPTHREVWVDD